MVFEYRWAKQQKASLLGLSLNLEDGTLDPDQFFPALSDELQRLADFNKCPLLNASGMARTQN